jgi:hypothetical protein
MSELPGYENTPQAQAYQRFDANRPTITAQARAALAAGRSVADVNKMLTNLGYEPLAP